MIHHGRSYEKANSGIEGNGLQGSLEQNTPTQSKQSSKFLTAELMGVLWRDIARLSRELLPPKGDTNSHVGM